MRTKEQILKDSTDRLDQVPEWDGTSSLHERLTIEVLIDIRDELSALITILGSVEKIAYRAG